MSNQPTAIAFDVDQATLASLHAAFPQWKIEAVDGATVGSLWRDAAPAAAELLVVGGHDREVETLRLCRSLRGQQGRSTTPLLALLHPGQETLIGATLDAGADSCLFLPVRASDLIDMLSRARAGDRPGQHTKSLHRPQQADLWRDDGGEG